MIQGGRWFVFQPALTERVWNHRRRLTHSRDSILIWQVLYSTQWTLTTPEHETYPVHPIEDVPGDFAETTEIFSLGCLLDSL